MEAPPALRPAIAEIRVLVEVGLVKIHQQVPVALSAVQQALKLLHKGLPPLRIGTAEQLRGFFPRQPEPLQGGADCLAADKAPEALAHIGDQAPERAARGRVGACYGRSGGPPLGFAHRLAEAGLDGGAKGGRPPVRRYASPSGPRSL